MQKKVIYTFPFPFYRPPLKNEHLFARVPSPPSPSVSPLQRGPDGRFGVAIEPVMRYDVEKSACSFFEIDMREERVVQHSLMRFPHLGKFIHMRPWYDQAKCQWSILLAPLAYSPHLYVYEIPDDSATPWLQVLSTEHLDKEYGLDKYHTQKSLVGFWQHENLYPLLFCEPELPEWYDVAVRWTYWRASQRSQLSYQYLNTSYQQLPYIGAEGCVLFTLQCVYDEMWSEGPYRKGGSGHWQFHVAAYEHTGKSLHQEWIPHVSMAIHDRKVPGSDFSHWLVRSMHAVTGPIYGPERKSTCVAALLLHDNRALKTKYRKEPVHERGDSQGGLYCLDVQGHLLASDESLSGIQTSMCTCGDEVIGATLQDEQWQLWRWNPSERTARTIHLYLPSMIRRFTVLAQECPPAGGASYFWCVEEYDDGICVVQRDCQTFQVRQSMECKGMYLVHWQPHADILDAKVDCIATYQDSLLVLAVNWNHGDGRLQLLQFQ